MKYLSIVIVILFLCACSSSQKTITSIKSKKAVTSQSKLAETTASSTSSNAPKQKNDNGKFHKRVKVVDSEGIVVGEASSYEEAEELLEEHNIKKKNDSINMANVLKKNAVQRLLNEHQLWSKLLQKHVSENGNVNYAGFKKDRKDLLAYIETLQLSYEELVQENDGTRTELLAYWINTYNALTIDLIVRNYPLNSIKDIEDPWDQRFWKFGNKWFNLNDIEHQILRKMNEPRIHFAIVCASESCPKLQNKAFTGDQIDTQLADATKEFLSDNTKNQLSENSIKLSRIFKWFGNDFKSKDSNLIDFLNQYSDVTISDTAKKSYLGYNWNLND